MERWIRKFETFRSRSPRLDTNLNRRQLLGGALGVGVAVASVAAATHREQLADEVQKAKEAVAGPEIKTLGIYDGNAQIFWEVDGEPLALRLEPFIKEDTKVNLDVKHNETVFGSEKWYALVDTPITVMYPEMVQGDNPDIGEKGSGLWIRLKEFITVEAVGDGAASISHRDAYVSYSVATDQFVSLDGPLKILPKQKDCTFTYAGDPAVHCDYVDSQGQPIDPNMISKVIPMDSSNNASILSGREGRRSSGILDKFRNS